MSSETFALLGVILAACAVFYQARAYHLSRRDLSLKVKDLSEVVHRLESEINERQVLDREHKRLKIDSLNQHAAALNHATHLGDIYNDTFAHLSKNIHGAVSDIQYILLAHNAVACGKRDGREAEASQLLDAVSVFCQARLAQLALADKWGSERDWLHRLLPLTASRSTRLRPQRKGSASLPQRWRA